MEMSHCPRGIPTLTVLQGKIIPDTQSEDELYVTFWMERNTHTWCLGHCILRNPDGTVKIEQVDQILLTLKLNILLCVKLLVNGM